MKQIEQIDLRITILQVSGLLSKNNNFFGERRTVDPYVEVYTTVAKTGTMNTDVTTTGALDGQPNKYEEHGPDEEQQEQPHEQPHQKEQQLEQEHRHHSINKIGTTPVAFNSVVPKWTKDNCFATSFFNPNVQPVVTLTIYDHALGSKPHLLGVVNIVVPKVNGDSTEWHDISLDSTKSVSGRLQVRLESKMYESYALDSGNGTSLKVGPAVSRQPLVTVMAGLSIDDVAAEPKALTANVMDSLLAKELHQLSQKEREAINEEIHGVKTMAIQENPALLREKLAEMEDTLRSRHRQHSNELIGDDGGITGNTHCKSEAYNEALLLGSQYIHDPSLRLMFLRSEFFDPAKAALRFVNFLQLIRDYLGPEALVHKPWTLSTFTSEELKIFKQGALQVFGRDRAGRRVTGLLGDFGDKASTRGRLKFHLYVNMATAEDVETQQKGMVTIVYVTNPSTTIFTSREERLMTRKILCYIPIRVSAIHMCFPDYPVSSVIKALLLATGTPGARVRIRFHQGSYTEIQYSLQTFGISPDQIPMYSYTGKMKTQNFLKWINMRKAIEKAKASGGPNFIFKGIECPSNNDVLLGRGRPYLIHIGNVAMRHEVATRLPRFTATIDKGEKAAIIWEVVQEIYQSGGRFLKEDPEKNGWWVEANDEEAKYKVGICFRDLKSYNKAATLMTSTEPTAWKTLKNPSSRTSAMSPRLLLQQAGRTSVGRDIITNPASSTSPPWHQEFDSSTYEFLEASSREHKRNKTSHCCDDWECFFGN